MLNWQIRKLSKKKSVGKNISEKKNCWVDMIKNREPNNIINIKKINS